MFRIVMLKNDKIQDVIYSPRLVYPQTEYEVRVDRCTYKSDINNHLIFENDVIEDENQEQYLVEYNQKRWILKSKKKSINELDNKKYKIQEKKDDSK